MTYFFVSKQSAFLHKQKSYILKTRKLALIPYHSLTTKLNITQTLSAVSTAAMPAMTALARLQQTFTTPSTEEIQKSSPCAICWADYDEGIMSYTPIKLLCRHVFGEKCLLKWAKGKTPSGYRKGCPLCHAELLPQSLWMRIRSKVAADMYYFVTHEPIPEVIDGGRTAQTIFLTLCLTLTYSFINSDELLGTPTAHALSLFITAYTSYQGVRFYGWLCGLNFGLLWGVLLTVMFRMIGFLPHLTFKVLQRLVLEMARF